MSQKLSFLIRKSDGRDKGVAGLMPSLDIAAALVTSGDKVLLVYNRNWGSFTFPMSKRRTWRDPLGDDEQAREEEWADAAARAAAECLGRTTTEEPEVLLDLADFQQSDRDGKWKRYHVRAFRVPVAEDVRLPSGVMAEWLSPDDIADEKRNPVSPTARHIIAELKLEGKV